MFDNIKFASKIGGFMVLEFLIASAVFLLFCLPGLAFAADVPAEQPQFALPPEQLYAAVIGALTPLVGYVLNYFAPWVSDKIKGLVQIGLVTLTGALYAVLDGGVDLFSEQALQLILTAFFAAFVAHTAAWKPTNVSTSLGGGRNVQDDPSR